MNSNFLLDTQAFVIAAQEETGLSAKVRGVLTRQSTHLYLSLASIWEMQIKISLGKLRLGVPLPEALQQGIHEMDLRLLPIHPDHIFKLGDLPWHHRDPFDRLLAAQALTMRLTLISGDREFDRYGVHRLW